MADANDAAARAAQRKTWAKALADHARQQRSQRTRRAAPQPKAGMTRIRKDTPN